MAGLGEAFEKLKKAAGENREKVAEGIHRAAEAAKEKTGGKYDKHIDKASGAARDYLDREAERPEQDRRDDDPGTGR
ncbi:antitoxin [Marinitenerispora sediminis]|uniref:Antitoxin protein n=1 Tax=Marinitenerispora sediminis TaxID=1931232 RepID=A0A368TCY1_9ACTN|nr:antitoxin [Marinitenerispora sediminis]RCV53813.1 antitoxin protein [Marinitenerispora sediminis]RCV58213.1 antitoxin protein [Marinitenerispora sediminis]RCV61490.1 antitoxin protein [Marinitenerispora sediminis]